MKRLLLFLLTFVLFLPLFSQEGEVSAKKEKSPAPKVILGARNTIFFEVGGLSKAASLNYERRLGKYTNSLGLRAGVSFASTGSEYTYFAMPLGINHMAGKNGHFFEWGLGFTYRYVRKLVTTPYTGGYFHSVTPSVLGTSWLGYRYHPIKGGLNLRVGVCPFIDFSTGKFVPWGGMSVGYSFGKPYVPIKL